jgi:hypothetical protein
MWDRLLAFDERIAQTVFDTGKTNRHPVQAAWQAGLQGQPYREYLAAAEHGGLEIARQAAAKDIEFLRNPCMGPNYSYLLYFMHECLWDVLYGLADVRDSQGHTQATSRFPDRDQILSLMTSFGEKNKVRHDAPEFRFAISLFFDEDPTILDYLQDRGDDRSDCNPAGEDTVCRVAIGLIYLTVYADLAQHWAFKKPTDLVLFAFGTTGTRMSMLFEDSTSIRKTFIELLERFQGICGILNRNIDGGELFWLNERRLSEDILDVYMPPMRFRKCWTEAVRGLWRGKKHRA